MCILQFEIVIVNFDNNKSFDTVGQCHGIACLAWKNSDLNWRSQTILKTYIHTLYIVYTCNVVPHDKPFMQSSSIVAYQYITDDLACYIMLLLYSFLWGPNQEPEV